MTRKSRHNFIHYILVVLLTLTLKTALAILFAGIGFLGYLLYWRLPSPFNLIVPIPLVGIGVSVLLVSLWEIWASIISFDYNRTHCPFCQPSSEPQEILSEKDGRGEVG